MIFDSLEHMEKYQGLIPGVDRILAEVKQYTKENYPVGSVVLEEGTLFYSLNDYETRSLADAQMEAHRKFIDVMYMVEGEEMIYVKPAMWLKNITREYDAEIDAQMADVDGDASAVRLQAGSFVVLCPQDAHAPACHAGAPGRVKKIIGKVRIS